MKDHTPISASGADYGVCLVDAEPWPCDAAVVIAEKDAAYEERNRLVAVLAKVSGWQTWISPAPDAEGWSIFYMESPAGQVSWHVRDTDLERFGYRWSHAPMAWDGHTTEQKYERLRSLIP